MIALLVHFILSAHASFPEYFGSSAKSTALAGQPSSNCDPSNNYYAGSLLAKCERSDLSYTISFFKQDMANINHIVVENSSMSSKSSLPRYGNVNTDYQTSVNHSLHLHFPLKVEGTATISIFSPLTKILTQDSGDPFLPEYVLYRSRHKRTELYLNYNRPLSERLAFSLGAHLGFNASSSLNAKASLNGTDYGSSGSAKTEVKPLAAPIASLSYEFINGLIFLSYQQEMKSELLAQAIGETATPPLPFDITLTSQLYYDPTIIRLGGQLGDAYKLHAMVEYQNWKGYKTPRINIHKESGVVQSSDDHEKIKSREIFIPKLGLSIKLHNDFTLSCGAFYRPSPLTASLSKAGNSLDSDTTAVALGITKGFVFYSDPASITLASQHHWLRERNVVKESGQEDGTDGLKIGSPGYIVGGKLFIFSLGTNFTF